jgi:soluble lytic murein transglycosylase
MTVARILLAAALLSGAYAATTRASAQEAESRAADPRIEWVSLQRAGRLEDALAGVERFLGSEPAGETLGAHYLRGRLLVDLGRLDRGAAALAAGLGSDPTLEPFTRYRLAQTEVARGHPEVAAGLLATLLSSRPPTQLAARGAELLALTLRLGGDCRLLSSLSTWSLPEASDRLLRLRRADCVRESDPETADRELLDLLGDDTSDGVALEAAERLALSQPTPDSEAALAIAMAFFGQRRFDKAIEFFASALSPGPGALAAARRGEFDTQYAVGRSYFWLGEHRRAAETFGDLATLTDQSEERARALYQRARSFELAGDGPKASEAFQASFDAEPDGSWAAAALTSMLRLEWLRGEEAKALSLFGKLGGRRRWQGSQARAALFLAASDLVRDRGDRARAWLDLAVGAPGAHLPEVAYWQGRLAEVQGDSSRAVQRYRAALVDDPFDPWAREAQARLGSPELTPWAERAAAGLAASGAERDLLAAWLLAPTEDESAAALGRLRSSLASRRPERAFMELAALPTERWPFWYAATSRRAEERLLSVGDWELGFAALAEHFPIDEAPLAMTRARVLAEDGLTRASILTAELLSQRAPEALPPVLWPEELSKLLYPMAFGAILREEAADAALDPRLLAALIREESRFDARATSAAAARGLTQFVLPTARRLGQILGLGTLDAEALHRPEISIRLGAAYLAELGTRFADREHWMLAAYNAGELQAELWGDYCFSDERAEYLTKVGFRETRNYLRKVLRSYAWYRELYEGAHDPPSASEADATTPGSGASSSSK